MDCSEEHLNVIYNLARKVFNDKYDITINGINTEVYVENADKLTNIASGIYSLKDGWIKEPSKANIPEIDQESIAKEVSKLEAEANKILENPSIDSINNYIDNYNR